MAQEPARGQFRAQRSDVVPSCDEPVDPLQGLEWRAWTMFTDRNKRGDRETATLLRHQSVAMKCTGDNTVAQSSVEKQKVSGRFGQLSCIIGRQSSKVT